jgi:predicted flavoprotein YhiN
VVERNNNRKTIEYRMDSFYQKDTPDMRQWKAAMKVRSTIERVGQLFTSSEKAKG